MKSEKEIRAKYDDIIPRSYNTKLDVFLFLKAVRSISIEEISIPEFIDFQITIEHTELYENAWQLKDCEKLENDGPTMSQIDDKIESWKKENNEMKETLFSAYKDNFQRKSFPFTAFQKLYPIFPEDRVCHYCKISDAEIKYLRQTKKIFSKRPRGYSMEIDRLNSNMEYSEINCVLACYWCNNAKTDEFTPQEFEDYIGPGIEKVWSVRKS